MLKNHLKLAWRNLNRNRVYTIVNVLGLSLGIVSGVIIFALINYQLSFDNFHKNAERTYRIVSELHGEEITYSEGVPAPLGKAFQNDFALTEQVARQASYSDQLITIPTDNTTQQLKVENNVAYVDPSFFDIFNFPVVYGNAKNSLAQPNTAVITQRLAKRYFNTEDAVGKIFRLNNQENFTVAGVLKDKPLNTDLKSEIYLSYANYTNANSNNWSGIYGGMQVFVRLKPGITGTTVNNALATLSGKHYDAAGAREYRFKLQPLSDLRFNETLGNPHAKSYLWALALVGVLLILTCCVNFVNLATAQSINRTKEVGIRKILGSSRAGLFWQFIVETAVITFAALFLVNILANLAIVTINTHSELQIPISFLNNWRFAIFAIVTFLMVVILSGFYPALVITGIQPLASLKNKLSNVQTKSFSLRKTLIVLQFVIAQILIISTIVVTKQINYSTNSDLGFEKNNIVMLPVPLRDKVKMNTLKTRFREIASVSDVSFCFSAPAAGSNKTTGVQYANRGKAEPWGINMKQGDERFISIFGIPLIAGRNLFPSDTTREFLVNETFVKKLGVSNAAEVIGKNISINGNTLTAPIVGVVKDFYNYSFRDEIAPVCIMSDNDDYSNCAVKIEAAHTAATMNAIKKFWNDTYPDQLYSYQFVDERIAKFYKNDKLMLMLIRLFTGIAIFISCLGLYGMISFMAFRKTKEIGVRKVLGASIAHILWLFGREFGKLLLLAFLLSAPIAWWSMHLYLQEFKYRIPINVAIFILAILVTTSIAAITIFYRALKAALANPVKSLRTE
jgi:putative ABC transport system permease protein